MDKIQTITFSYIFYKTDDTPGWLVARFMGADEEILAKIKKHALKEYRIFFGGEFNAEFSEDFSDSVKHNLDPETAFMISDWIYCNELDRWFLPNEQMPIPKDSKEHTIHLFSYSVQYDEDRNDDLDEISDEESELEGKKVFYSVAKVTVNDFSFEWEYTDSYFEKFSKFFNNLGKKEFSVISIDEYDYIKILVWPIGKEIRVIFQDYSYHDNVREVVSIKMDSVSFISKFKGLLNDLQKKHDEYKIKFNRCTDNIGKNYFDTSDNSADFGKEI